VQSLPPALAQAHLAYVEHLARSGLTVETVRSHAFKVRRYLGWLARSDVTGDPLSDPVSRDRAIRQYVSQTGTVVERGNVAVHAALAAVDDFYARAGIGRAKGRIDRRQLIAGPRRQARSQR
jgi:hypothetical protein